VLYVTERCVFRLTPEGLELTEIAPGVDLELDILAQMTFKPKISANLRAMDPRIFKPEPMTLRTDMLALPMDRRFNYDANQNILFLNFEGLNIRSKEQVEQIRTLVEKSVAGLQKRVYTIVNYDNFQIEPEILDEYMDMVRDVVTNFYSGVTRYTTSTFMRARLGDALEKRTLAAHIYESANEALAELKPDAN